jgi:hypothetical protein
VSDDGAVQTLTINKDVPKKRSDSSLPLLQPLVEDDGISLRPIWPQDHVLLPESRKKFL